MNAPERLMALPDVQSDADLRDKPIDRVGIRGVRTPRVVATADGALATVAVAEMTVGLPGHVKGTHMSRFVEILEAERPALDVHGLLAMLRAMLARLEADRGDLELSFPYFVRKVAPVSGVESLMDYAVRLRARGADGRAHAEMEVVVPVTSLCPCSKNISQYGAHNQRSHVTIRAELAEAAALPIERLVRVAEQAASCELWGLLKRPDEKYVTERAYENPKFVEDLVRDVALSLDGIDEVVAYSVESENFESIHNHSAYARIDHDKRAVRARAA